MKMFFFHGKLSNPETSQTAKAFSEYFEHNQVWIPDYKPTERSHPEIYSFLKNYIADRISCLDTTVFVGISLGGYWALEMANAFPDSVCVLLNPSLHYYNLPIVVRSGLPLTAVFNADDELLDNHATAKDLVGRADIHWFGEGGHRMSNIQKVLPWIENAIYRETL